MTTPKSTEEMAKEFSEQHCSHLKYLEGRPCEDCLKRAKHVQRLILQARIEELKSAMTSGGFGRIMRLEELTKQLESIKD